MGMIRPKKRLALVAFMFPIWLILYTHVEWGVDYGIYLNWGLDSMLDIFFSLDTLDLL